MVIQTYQQLKEEMVFKRILIWKMAIASSLSWEIAKFFGSDHPYLAPSTVIVCLQTTINRSLRYSYHRVTGTVIGIIVAEFLLPYLDVSVWALGIIILTAGFISKWLNLDESTIHQAALAVVLIFVVGHSSGDYPLDRFRNTIIGALTACFVQMLIFPPNFISQAGKSVQQVTGKMADTMERVADWVQTGLGKNEGESLQKEMEEILIDLHHSKNIVQDALDSLKFNIFANKSKIILEELKKRIELLSEGYSYLDNLMEIFKNWATEGTITALHQQAWSLQLAVLIPYFQSLVKGDKHSFPEDILTINVSPEQYQQQFHISLYQETKSLLAKLTDLNQTSIS